MDSDPPATATPMDRRRGAAGRGPRSATDAPSPATPTPDTGPGADARALAARIRRSRTEELTRAEIAALRAMLEAAFGPDEEERFREEDWQHSIGGLHIILEEADAPLAHAAVVERRLEIGGRPLRTGYVEAVATAPGHRGLGLGSRVMQEVAAHIREGYELGALATGALAFYSRLGWLTWQGPTSVRTAEGELRTPDEDGYIMVLPTPSSPPLDLGAPISCEWRPGDVW